MRIILTPIVERWLPAFLSGKALPYAAALDSIFIEKDDRSVSQRIAIYTFFVRVISAGILGSLACLGIHTAVIRFVPEYLAKDQLPLLRGVLIGSRLQGVITATVF